MDTIKTDDEYNEAIRSLLKEIDQYLTFPESLISRESQERLLYSVISRAKIITKSEPHLRGAVVKALDNMRALDLEKAKREADRCRGLAQDLYEVLSEIPAARLGRGLAIWRKQVLEAANKML